MIDDLDDVYHIDVGEIYIYIYIMYRAQTDRWRISGVDGVSNRQPPEAVINNKLHSYLSIKKAAKADEREREKALSVYGYRYLRRGDFDDSSRRQNTEPNDDEWRPSTNPSGLLFLLVRSIDFTLSFFFSL